MVHVFRTVEQPQSLFSVWIKFMVGEIDVL